MLKAMRAISRAVRRLEKDFMTRWDRTGVAALAAAMTIGTVALSGCGGGGGGGGGGSTPTNYTITGTILNSGAADPGVTVKFDANSSISAVTDSSGHFTLTVPQSAITGSDYVAIYASSGTINKSVTETNGVPANLGTIDVGTTSYTITGTILNSGAPVVGVTVKFDANSSISAVTNSAGSFSLTVPKTAITGSDYVAIYASSGTVNKPVTETAGVPANLGTIDIGTTSYTITGTLLNSGAPDVGITVKYDNNSAISAVTDSNGNFSLTVPKSAITGSDYVSIYIVVGSTPVKRTITETNGVPANLGTIDVGLPPPPPLVSK
jgi:hypothetical protein